MEITETFSAEQTAEYAKKLAEHSRAGDIYTLDGDLGAGKTVFAKGFAEALGIIDTVNSPTFLILQEYRGGRMPLYHFDAYRIEDSEELREIGFDDYIDGDGVCLIEWASRISECIPDRAKHIRIERDISRGTDYRRIVYEE